MSRETSNVVRALDGWRFRWLNEYDLQDQVGEALRVAGIRFDREVRASARDRFDFLTAGRICIEIKVAGTAAQVTSQLRRYSKSNRVDGLVLVSSRPQHVRVPSELNGKPVRVRTVATSAL